MSVSGLGFRVSQILRSLKPKTPAQASHLTRHRQKPAARVWMARRRSTRILGQGSGWKAPSFKIEVGRLDQAYPEKAVPMCYLGTCQNYGPFLGTPNSRCPNIIGTQEGTIILTTTHLGRELQLSDWCRRCLRVRRNTPSQPHWSLTEATTCNTY